MFSLKRFDDFGENVDGNFYFNPLIVVNNK